MSAATTSLKQISEFFAQKRIAMVGVSRDPKDFTRILYAEFKKRGYDIIPVNPNLSDLDGQRAYARVQDIKPGVDGVLVVTPSKATDQVVRDCAEAGVTRVWLHRGEGIGSVSDQAVTFCQEHGINVVVGHCPFMFLPQTPFFHKIHGYVKKLTGSYPVSN